jgi:hypothetical protein
MPRKGEISICRAEDFNTLNKWAASRTAEARLVERAKIIVMASEGVADTAIAIDKIAEESPDQENHVVMDNCRIHKKRGERLAAHPNFSFHIRPPAPPG